MQRRNFLEIAGKGVASGLVTLASSKVPYLTATEVPYVQVYNGRSRREELNQGLLEHGIYDPNYFQAAERFMPFHKYDGIVSLLPREDKAFSVKLEFSVADAGIAGISPTSTREIPLNGEPLDIPVFFGNDVSGKFKYRVLYREDNGPWNATEWRTVNTPHVLAGSGDMKFYFVGDPHPFDDSDMGGRILKDPELIEMRRTGDAVNYFLTKLLTNPAYVPKKGSEEAKLMYNFCLASAINQLMLWEKMGDMCGVIDMGDTWGGAAHKWIGLGLKDPDIVTDAELDAYAKMFSIAFRKTYSAMSSDTTVARAYGNHDGRCGYDTRMKDYTIKWNKIHQPVYVEEQAPSTHSGHLSYNPSPPDQGYYKLDFGVFGADSPYDHVVTFFMLDSQGQVKSFPLPPEKMQDWTTGRNQGIWLGENLPKNKAKLNVACSHHVFGGAPTESDPNRILSTTFTPGYVYGRLQMFLREHYEELKKMVPEELLGDLDKVEQPAITNFFKENNGDIWFHGHDHVCKVTEIGTNSRGNKTYAVCVGSPNYELYKIWIESEVWQNKKVGGYGKSGGYGKDATGDCDFYGAPGITRLTVDDNRPPRIEYLCTGNTPYTNLRLDSQVPGDVLFQFDM